MKLWTFQSPEAAAAIRKTRRFHASWKFADAIWRTAYLWMIERMEERGISTQGYPPIWAWFRCGHHHGVPNQLTARLLLSEVELARGVYLLELEVPHSGCLLSSYDAWNEAAEHMFDTGSPPGREFDWMFDIGRVGTGTDIQASLPFILRPWILKLSRFKVRK